MSGAYICQTCRRELHRRLTGRHKFQWLPKATFISFNDIIPPQKEKDKERDLEQNSAQWQPYAAQRKQDRQNDASKGAATPSKQEAKEDEASTIAGRYSRFEAGGPDGTGALSPNSENLRNLRASLSRSLSSLTPTEAAKLNPPPMRHELDEEQYFRPATRAVADAAIKADTPAAKLWRVLSKKDHDVNEAWDMFNTYYLKPGKNPEALRNLSPQDRFLIREKNLFRELLRSVATHWQPGDERLPSPAKLVQILHEYSIMGRSWYLLEILELVYRTMRLRPETTADQVADTRIIFEEQILALWSQWLRNAPARWVKSSQKRMGQPDGDFVNWNGTPQPEEINLSRGIGHRLSYRFSWRLHRLFDNLPVESAQHMGVAALFTFDHFCHQYCRSYTVTEERVPYEPFLWLMVRLLHGAVDVDIAMSLGLSLAEDNNVPKEEIESIKKRFGHLQQRAALAFATDSLEVLGEESINLDEEQEDKLIAHFNTRIKRQIEKKNRGVIDQLWDQALVVYGYPNAEGVESSKIIPTKIYSAFLFGYRDLMEPERQAQVWNHMLASGVSPDPKQWGLMISARMKHLNSMEHIWNRMLASGVNADHQTWCTRLSGHIYYGNPEDGIGLLYQWGNTWFAEVKKIFTDSNSKVPEMSRLNRDGPTVPRPNTDTLTTVITALVQRKGGKGRRLDLVPDAFAWAQTFGVKPNLWTFNTLFRTCLKDGNLKDAMQIIAKMEEDGIKPDEYTFFAFADFVFKQSKHSSMTDEEQSKLMLSVLDMLETRGFQPNAVFFGSMIDNLLKRGKDLQPNINAAMMLLQIMLNKNITVTSPIWTSLMTYHFQEGRRPDGPSEPDFDAIETLWRRMHNMPLLSLDAVFYDRMIEGFGSFGKIDRALTLMERMSKEGKRPSWSALMAVLNAYIQHNDLEAAKMFVADVVRGTGLLKDGIRSARGDKVNREREKFFGVAAETGLLTGKEDLDAVQEYVIDDSAGLQLPDGDGYEKYRGAQGTKPSLDYFERKPAEPMDFMPGWDEIVEKQAASAGR